MRGASILSEPLCAGVLAILIAVLPIGCAFVGPDDQQASTESTITSDDQVVSTESICDGLPPDLFGLCKAYCEAQDCDEPEGWKQESRHSCEVLLRNYERVANLVGVSMWPPCLEQPGPGGDFVEICEAQEDPQSGDFWYPRDDCSELCPNGTLCLPPDANECSVDGICFDYYECPLWTGLTQQQFDACCDAAGVGMVLCVTEDGAGEAVICGSGAELPDVDQCACIKLAIQEPSYCIAPLLDCEGAEGDCDPYPFKGACPDWSCPVSGPVSDNCVVPLGEGTFECLCAGAAEAAGACPPFDEECPPEHCQVPDGSQFRCLQPRPDGSFSCGAPK